MRVGVVGGGGAGLAAAWLLEAEHEVTLLERGDRLGGHATTVEVPLPSGTEAVDVGPEFLSPALHPTLLRLMRLTGTATSALALSLTLFHTRGGRALVLPPFQPGHLSAAGLHPRVLADLLRLRRVIARAPVDVRLEGGPFTVDEVLDDLGAGPGFRRRLFYPLVGAGWCVDLADFRAFAAHNVMRYLAAGVGSAFRPPSWLKADGGMGAYVRALARSLRRAQIRLSSPATAVAPIAGGYRIRTDCGAIDVEALIVATSAADARDLLAGVSAAQGLCRVLGTVRYATTRIAVHADTRLMPPRRRDWSAVNIRFDGAHSQSSVWTPANPGAEVFKSWVTYDSTLPEPLYAQATFAHGMIDRAYFEAQRALGDLQGEGGIWLAGLYTAGIDSHESAIASAVRIAERLAPDSPRLRELKGAMAT